MGSSSSKPLNDDTLATILEFVGNKSYRSFGGLNKHCREIYLSSGMTKETFLFGYGPLSRIIDKIERGGEFNWALFERVGKGVVSYGRSDVLDWSLEERNNNWLLSGICDVASKEGRIDLLDEVWNYIMNDEDRKRIVFLRVDEFAARGGKLNVLKWFEKKGLHIRKEYCANEAARHGQLHILKWLREEKGLELNNGKLYNYAIQGGHLHVMKWLREQGCPWGEDTFELYESAIYNGHLHVLKWLREQGCPSGGYTFRIAAEEGNLAILQWLHDEGCPWPRGNDDAYGVCEEDLKPEVVDWCRMNGYGDRIYLESDISSDSVSDSDSDSDDY